MTLPKRWLEDDGADGAVRDVLRLGEKMDPPAGAERAVWLALVAQIGAAGAGTAAAGASAKAAAGASMKAAATATASASATVTAASGGLLKAILIGAISGVVVVSGYSALEPSAPAPVVAPPSSTTIAPVVAPQRARTSTSGAPATPAESPAPPAAPAPTSDAREPAPTSAAPAVAPPIEPSGAALPGDAPAVTPEPAVGAGAPLPGSAEERESRLREESELLQQARGALRSGDPGRAMQLLEKARQKFPGGVLGQEREALTIEALARSGARDAASARAAEFIKAHPTSPHAARLQAFVLPAPAP